MIKLMLNRIILPEDTLESIAREINLENPDFILQFHNSQCAKEDVIQNQLVPWKKLHIPGKDMIEKVNAEVFQELEKPQYNPDLKFSPTLLDGNFRTIILESSTNPQMKKDIVKIIYEISLKYKETRNNLHIIEYSKSKFRGSHEGILSDLALKCLEKISPLLIFLNEKGYVEKIEIKQEVIEDFPKIKNEILNYFTGEIAESYVENFEIVVKNSSLFSKKMKEDLFIRTYFAPVRNKFYRGKSSARIPFGQNEEWEIIQKPEEYSEETLKIKQILANSTVHDENYKNYEGYYSFNPKTFLIEECEIIFQQNFRVLEKETKIHIKKV